MVVVVSMAACSENVRDGQSADAASPGTDEAEEAASDGGLGTTYQRTVVFVDTSKDTAMFVPWDFENRAEADGVRRSVRGWLGRGGQWSQFMEDEWTTAPTRAPWRIVHRGAVRLVIGQEDALQDIYYQQGLRELSVGLGDVVVEWSGQRGGTYRLLAGTARLSGVETEGLVLDVFTARARESDQFAEWGLLIGDDQLQFLIADLEGPGEYRAWARHRSEDLFWPTVTVTWAETRTFERARREIPVGWRFESSDGDLSGEFESVSWHLQTLEGAGAILPVLGVYEVAGHVTTGGTRIPVRGFLRHFQR